MKNILLNSLTLLLLISAFGQSPNSFKYQMVVRNSKGNVLNHKLIGIRVSILQGNISGTAEFVESSSLPTNEFGLINLEIGSSNTRDFASIDWSAGPYYLKTEIDTAGGTKYTDFGTSQLLSVPYALYAEHTPPTGQTSTNYYGTDFTFVSNLDTDYKLINGLSVKIEVPDSMTTLLHSNGSAYATVSSAFASVTIALFIDGVEVSTGGRCRLKMVTDNNISSGGGNWSINYPVSLSPGTHSIDVMVKGNSQNESTVTIDNSGNFDLSTLTVTFLKK